MLSIFQFLTALSWLVENYPVISLADIVPFDAEPTHLQRIAYDLVLFLFGRGS